MTRDGRIQRRVRELQNYLRDKQRATPENITEQFRLIAMTKASSLSIFDEDQHCWRNKRPDELTEGEKALIREVTIKDRTVVDLATGDKCVVQDFIYRLHDNKSALDSLARCKGMFKEVNVHSHQIAGKVDHLFKFVAENQDTSETVAILNSRHKKGKTYDA